MRAVCARIWRVALADGFWRVDGDDGISIVRGYVHANKSALMFASCAN